MKPIVIAHRGGARGIYRENTREAFKYAVRKRFPCVEMDIRLDHLNKRFFVEHDFLYLPRVKQNALVNIINVFPKETVLFTELKTRTLIKNYYAQAFCEFVKKNDLEKQVVVISYNPFVLKQIRKIAPHLKLGFLVGTMPTFYLARHYVENWIDPEYLIFSKRILSREKVQYAKKRGYKVLSWSLNKEAEWEKASDLELDGIITDYAEKAIDFFNHQN